MIVKKYVNVTKSNCYDRLCRRGDRITLVDQRIKDVKDVDFRSEESDSIGSLEHQYIETILVWFKNRVEIHRI